MSIKTRFDVGDECWVMISNKPTKFKITGVYVWNTNTPEGIYTNIEYTIGHTDSMFKYMEENLSATKEELISKL
jgi:hypothetical protein